MNNKKTTLQAFTGFAYIIFMYYNFHHNFFTHVFGQIFTHGWFDSVCVCVLLNILLLPSVIYECSYIDGMERNDILLLHTREAFRISTKHEILAYYSLYKVSYNI